MIRLLCADVDGTLVGANGAVHPETWVAAQRARAAGIRLALCSGRPGFGLAREYAERIEPGGWHIFQNGTSVVHLATNRTHSAYIAPDVIARLKRRALETGRVLELYSDLEYAVAEDSPRTRAHAELLGVPFTTRALDDFGAPVVRAQWLVGRESAAEILAEPHPGIDVSPSTSPVMPDTLFVGLLPEGVDKATGVRAVAAEYGIALDDVMFVGDSWNDLPALRVVGYPVAVANAEPEVLAIARHVVGDVDAGGLAQAMALALHLSAIE